VIEINCTIPEGLVERAASGDRIAQAGLYEALVERVHRVVLRIVGETDADDVTQDVFINVFKKMHSFRADANFSTWVHRLAVNDALQHLRRVRRRPMLTLDEARMCPSVSPSDAQQADVSEQFEVAYARLETELRVILELKEIERMSYAEIAKVVGIPEGTVGSRLNRARRELRAHLSALGWEG
jgi:RNA polymerase sigma-70 factor (ECF subfamily)